MKSRINHKLEFYRAALAIAGYKIPDNDLSTIIEILLDVNERGGEVSLRDVCEITEGKFDNIFQQLPSSSPIPNVEESDDVTEESDSISVHTDLEYIDDLDDLYKIWWEECGKSEDNPYIYPMSYRIKDLVRKWRDKLSTRASNVLTENYIDLNGLHHDVMDKKFMQKYGIGVETAKTILLMLLRIKKQ